MCYGICIHEKWNGECGKRSHDVCPEMYEDIESYEKAQIKAAEYAELAAEAKWEMRQERRNEIYR